MDPSNINWLAVLAAAASTFVLGGLWYSPLLFERPWRAAAGVSEDQLRRNVGPVFATSFVLALVMATNLAFFLGKDADVTWGVTAGLLAGVGWVWAGLAITQLFERRPVRLVLIDGGYHAVAFAIMGAILGAWH